MAARSHIDNLFMWIQLPCMGRMGNEHPVPMHEGHPGEVSHGCTGIGTRHSMTCMSTA